MNNIFQTERLFIRDLTQSDIDGFHEMQGDSEVMKFTTGRPFSYEENVQDLKHVISCYDNDNDNNEFWVWAICLKRSNEFVGTCAVVSTNNETEKEYEIGFRFLKKNWGKGYASEIILPLLEYGYIKCNTSELVAYVDERNSASIQVLRKANPVLEEKVLNPETNLPDLRFLYKK